MSRPDKAPRTVADDLATVGEPAVRVDDLTRVFRVAERKQGLRAFIGDIFHRTYREVTAVEGVTFQVNRGEIVGVLGPNGSGKTTTLKCISGLLTPTRGSVEVLGFVPSERRDAFLRRVGFIMGQRSQLHQDVSVLDSLEMRRVVYGLGRVEFEDSRDELVELLSLTSFAATPVRQLSLGQRMRCEFAAALLHRPDVVLLDEPTIGLDFDAQAAIRGFVQRYVANHGASVLLTSHYLLDIEAMASRAVALARGRLLFSGSLAELRQCGGASQLVTLRGEHLDLSRTEWAGLISRQEPGEISLEIGRAAVPTLLAQLSALPGLVDLTLSDPPLETALAHLYAGVGDEPEGVA